MLQRLKKFSGLAALFLAAWTAAALAPAARAETLVIGTVGKDVKSELKEFLPLADYLKGRLAADGIDHVEVLVVPSAAKMAQAFQDGRVHLYFESPLVGFKAGEEGGAVPMLRRWKKGVAEYWSEIVVKSDSPITSVDELKGRTIAFEDPDSTSGHHLPRAMLLQKGIMVEDLKSLSQPVDPAKVGAVFTMGDRTSILWLFDGRVAAIATDPHYMARIEKERPGSLRSLGRSITVPRQVVMRASNMPEARVQRLSEVLTGMHGTDDGRRALSGFGATDRFDAFLAGVDATFLPIKEQLQVLAGEGALALTKN